VARTVPQFEETLKRVRGSRPVTFIEEGPLKVGDLIWIDSPAVSPFNLVTGWPVPTQSFHDSGVLEELSRTLAAPTGSPMGPMPRRVFLTRSQERRKYNQAEVGALLSEYGFESIAPETLTLEEQVSLFGGLDLAIGASGAAWTNLLFTRPGSKGLLWAPDPYRGFNVFANLAQQSGCELRYHLFPSSATSTGEAYDAPYELDIDALRVDVEELVSGNTRG
jgi:capsular polysaccharide biosynthesis protein